MKNKRLFKLNIIIVIFAIAIFCIGKLASSFVAAQSAEENGQEVQIGVRATPKIDITLAKSRTSTDVTPFKDDIINSLKKLNVDTDDTIVNSLEAEEVNLSNSFQWNQDIDGSVGSISITGNGQNVEMRGNPTNAGKNAIWIIPEGNQEQTFNFNYSINYGDSFKAAGMLLRVKQANSSTLTGYMLSFNKSGQDYYSTSSNLGALWEFTYDMNNRSNMTKTLVGGINIQQSGTITVTATDSQIRVSGGGLTQDYVYNIPASKTDIIGNGYGFFTDHYSHNCSSIGSFALNNISLRTVTVKSLSEVLRLASWRNNAYKIFVYITDEEDKELKLGNTSVELITRIINENIYFVPWGNSINRQQMENIVNSCEQGYYVNNTINYNNSISETATYIKSLLDQDLPKDTILLNEPLTLTVTPPEIEKGTIQQPEWPFGKWKVEHDYTYFENDLGQYSQAGKYTSDMIRTFDKTGKYTMTYKDQPTIPSYIYVHRRPTALMNLNIDNMKVNLESISYDLDKFSTDNGISETVWKYKAMDDMKWSNGKLQEMQPNKSYLIQLKVKDYQDTWSYPVTKYVTTDKSALPVAMYNFETDQISKYENLTVIDSSYDPAGRNIVKYKWEIYRADDLRTPIHTETTVSSTPTKTNFINEGEGQYVMYLTVTNSDNMDSERYGRIFEVTDDLIAPEFVANPTSCDWKKSEIVNLQFSDRGGSGFKEYKYCISNSQEAVEDEWSSPVQNPEGNIEITKEGNIYLHVKGYDNAKNESIDRALGPYKIDRTAPVVEVHADFETITTEPIEINIHSEDPLSGVKEVRVNGQKLEGTEESKFIANTNGKYLLEVEDVAGNIYQQEIVITNIYQHCNAGLGHPDFPTDVEHCPVCELIKGLSVVAESENAVYDAKEKHVMYYTSSTAQIIEYYNDSTQAPVEVGSYKYELKVLYEGEEYRTGVEGTFIITPKPITIEDIVAVSREYNGTNIVNLQGGRLVGVEEPDLEQVGFVLPETGTIPSKNVGKYYVMIPEIILNGDKSKNYELIQPKTDTVVVEINKKKIDPNSENEEGGVRVVGISATNRQYDGTNIVEIQGGELVGIEECDKGKVDFVLSQTGTTPSKDVGEYNVLIPEIILIGEEANNYEITQPKEDEVKVTISKRQVSMDYVKGKDRKYDKTDIVEMESGKLQNVIEGEDVTVIIPEKGIAENSHVGSWLVDIEELVLSGNDILNYELIQPDPETITVNILKPDQPEFHIEPYISKINDVELKNTIPIASIGDEEITYDKEELKDLIRYADQFTITIRIYNEGPGAGYIQKITNIIPEGTEFIKNNETNLKYQWELEDQDKLTTEYLNFDSGVENEIAPLNDEVDYREVSLTLEVIEKEKKDKEVIDKTITNAVDIENVTATENIQEIKLPKVLSAIPEIGWKNRNKTVTIVAQDDAQIGIKGYAITKEKEEPTEWIESSDLSWTSTEGYEEGIYYAWVKDKSGNVSEPKEFEVNKIDKESPVITDFIKDVITLKGVFKDDISGIAEYQFSKDDVDENSEGWKIIHNPKPGEITKIETIIESGEYYLYVKDQAGNISKSDESITIAEEEIYDQTEKEVNATFIYFDNDTKKQVEETVKGLVLKGKNEAIISPPNVHSVNVELYGKTITATPRGWSRNSESNSEIEVGTEYSVNIPKEEDNRVYYMSYEHTVKYKVNTIDNQTNRGVSETKQIDIYVNSEGVLNGEDKKLDLPEVIAPNGFEFYGWTKDSEEPSGTLINIETERPEPNSVTEYHASYKKDITVERYIYKNQKVEPTLQGTVYKNDIKTNAPKFILGEIESIQITEDENGKPLDNPETAIARGWSTSPELTAEIEIPSSSIEEKEYTDSTVYYASYNYGNKYTFIGPDGNRAEGTSGTNVDYLGNRTAREGEEDKFPKLPDAPIGWSPRGWVKGGQADGEIVDTERQKPETGVEYYATYQKNVTANRYVYSNEKLDAITKTAYKNYIEEIPAEIDLQTAEKISIKLNGEGELLKVPIEGNPRHWSISQEADAEDSTENNIVHILQNTTYYMSYDFKVKLVYNDGENDHEDQRNAKIGYDGKTKGDEFYLEDQSAPQSYGEGWIFHGWTRDEEEPNGKLVKQNKNGEKNPDKINPESKYFASFKKLITITFDANTGNPPVPDPQSEYKYKNANKEIAAQITIPNTKYPTKEENDLGGWDDIKTSEEAKYTMGQTYDFMESTILYAVWKEKDRIPPTIEFNPNGNEIWAKSQTTTVTVKDNVSVGDEGNLKYIVSTKSEQPNEEDFVENFESGKRFELDTNTGKYYLWILARDVNGNQIIQRSNAFYIDNKRPTISNVTSDRTVSKAGGVKITGTAKDDDSGIVAYMFSKNPTLNADSEGWESLDNPTTLEITEEKRVTESGKWYFYAKDSAGNFTLSMIDVSSNYFDNIRPTITLEPNNGWTKSVQVTITYPDIDGLEKTYSKDGGLSYETTTQNVETFTITENETKIIAKSKLGETQRETEKTITNIDNQGPIVSMTIDGDTATSLVQDIGCGTSKVKYVYEGTNASGQLKNESEWIDYSNYGNSNVRGTFGNLWYVGTLEIVAVDKLGNESHYKMNVNNVDNIPPVISLIGNSARYIGEQDCPECRKKSRVYEVSINYTDEISGIIQYSTEIYSEVHDKQDETKVSGHSIFTSVPEFKSTSGTLNSKFYLHEEDGTNANSGNLYIKYLDRYENYSNQLEIPYNYGG